MKDTVIVKVATEALHRAFTDLPARINVQEAEDGKMLAFIRLGNREHELELLWGGDGWPSEIRSILARPQRSWPRHTLVVARSFSPGALRLLREADANWADESGRARIVVPPGLAILREVASTPKVRGAATFRWSRSAIEIAEYVLHSNLHQLRTGHLQVATGWSAAQVSKILSAFEELGWIERRGGRSGRSSWYELAKPGVLLDAWASEVSHSVYERRLGHRAYRDLVRFAFMELGPALGEDRNDWAITTWAGLQMITPYSTTTPALHVYVEEKRFSRDLDSVMQVAEIREVEEGARIEFWRADFRLLTQPGKTHPLPVASTPRLYADLLRLKGRAADAAQHLRETVLGY